jgi:hypothetical protein
MAAQGHLGGSLPGVVLWCPFHFVVVFYLFDGSGCHHAATIRRVARRLAVCIMAFGVDWDAHVHRWRLPSRRPPQRCALEGCGERVREILVKILLYPFTNI